MKESLIKCCSLELHIVAARFILMVVGFGGTVNNFDKGTLSASVWRCHDVAGLFGILRFSSVSTATCRQHKGSVIL